MFARDAEGRARGGLLGVVAWGWLYVQALWLPADLRGAGLGTELLRRAEEVARDRGCRAASLDTFDFQALPFYRKLGYLPFAVLEDRPPGHRQFFLRKALEPRNAAIAAEPEVRLELGPCVVRDLRPDDAPSLARHANNRAVWRGTSDRFPHPYTEGDARRFIEGAAALAPRRNFAIEADGQVVGGIGVVPRDDVERVSAELGYWLGEAYWGRGIATAAVRAVTALAMDRFALSRVYGVVFEWNHASARVLEKAGFGLEGRMRRSAIKDGVVQDQRLYGFVRG